MTWGKPLLLVPESGQPRGKPEILLPDQARLTPSALQVSLSQGHLVGLETPSCQS